MIRKIDRLSPFSWIKFQVNENSSKEQVLQNRPAQIAELPRSKFDPELFPHKTYVEIFVTFATKVPYLTFCDKMRRFFIWKWIHRK